MKTKPVLMAFLIFSACLFSYGCKTVTYDANGATSGTIPDEAKKYFKGATVTVLDNTGSLAKTGYEFSGWNTAANGSGTDYAAGATFKMDKEAITLYADWTQSQVSVTYTVTYNANGATGGITPTDTNQYAEGATVTVLDNTGSLVKTGSVFSGWNTQPGGDGTSYAAGATFVMGMANVALYAAWVAAPPTYSVTYDDNQSTGGSAPIDANNYGQGATVTVLGNTDNMSRTGLNFADWNTAADGSGISYSPGATFTMGTADVLLTAKWAAKWTRLQGLADNSTSACGIGGDGLGNSYVTGYIYDTDGFVTKYNAVGAEQWTEWLSTPGAGTEGWGITVAGNGDCYITGKTVVDMSGQPVRDAFIAKYNASGEKQWAATSLLGATGGDTEGRGIAIDENGNSYITGFTYGVLDGQTKKGDCDMFVAKFDASGALAWARQLGPSDNATAYTQGLAIAVDAEGSSYITGYIDGGTLDGNKATGIQDAFVIKHDTAGARKWVNLIGSAGKMVQGNGIAVTADGTSYVTGYTRGDLFGEPVVGTSAMFLIKHDASGTRLWTELLGQAASGTQGNAIAVDATGHSYITGNTTARFEPKTENVGMFVFAAKYDASGAKLWVKQRGDFLFSYNAGYGIALDANGICYVAGETDGNLDNETITGDKDLFITTRLNP